jgi:hypothetical protein
MREQSSTVVFEATVYTSIGFGEAVPLIVFDLT